MSIISLCKQINDTRIDRKKEHSVESIVYIAMAGVLCGADSWNEIEEFGNSRKDFFAERIPSFRGVPSHDTFNRFFSSLSPDYFERVFRYWMSEICGKYEGIVAIDGKTIRGASKCTNSNPKGESRFKLHMVSAWAAANGVTLGQVKVSSKSNEITAIPELLSALDLQGCIVTLDAMGCQKAIAKNIIDKKADYVLHVKSNQRKLYADLQAWFEELDKSEGDKYSSYDKTQYAKYRTEEIGHGRKEIRECFVYSNSGFEVIYKEWEGIKSIVRITSERTIIKTGETSLEKRYYITSLSLEPKKIAESVRTHWSVENNLHWQLDVSFGEDAGRKTGNAAQNFSLMNKIALMILKKSPRKGSIKGKRKAAGWDQGFLCELLLAQNF